MSERCARSSCGHAANKHELGGGKCRGGTGSGPTSAHVRIRLKKGQITEGRLTPPLKLTRCRCSARPLSWPAASRVSSALP